MALIYNHAWNIKNYRYVGDVSHVRRDADHDVSWQEAATMTPVRSSLMRDRASDEGCDTSARGLERLDRPLVELDDQLLSRIGQ